MITTERRALPQTLNVLDKKKKVQKPIYKFNFF